MIDFYNNKLRSKSYKLTKQRETILEFLLANQDKHLSCEEIYHEIHKSQKDLGQATVYRTLQIFTEVNITSKHDFDDGKSRYEISSITDRHNHHHLICLACGNIEEVKLDLMENLEKTISNKYNFTIVDHNVKIYGYCKKCGKGRHIDK
ncbi:MAG: Fur family transcriptional regulator [Eubacteriales bacterium]